MVFFGGEEKKEEGEGDRGERVAAAEGGRKKEARVRGRGRLLVIKGRRGEERGEVAWWWSCDGTVAREEDDKERRGSGCWASEKDGPEDEEG